MEICAILRQAKIWLFSCILRFLGSAQIPFDGFLCFFHHAILPSACGPEMVRSVVSSHARRTQTPGRFFGAHWSSQEAHPTFSLEMEHLHANEGAWYVWKRPFMRTRAEGGTARSRPPQLFLLRSAKLLLINASHITVVGNRLKFPHYTVHCFARIRCLSLHYHLKDESNTIAAIAALWMWLKNIQRMYLVCIYRTIIVYDLLYSCW